METHFFSKLFIGIALFTSASVFAQATEVVTPNEGVKVEHLLKQSTTQDSGDIESLREYIEINRLELVEITTDRRFNGRQFRIVHKKS
ncbi:hypothetical protein [Providencia burhodogranariea]|uniref:Uncharacterized protein n=1 Tax=Providencia burhodogranariea DSM 19968 TaxID=1141662 RepID=K8WQC7_9GAMM|nr:hypothetical protein [Providencia burhodogranariea]EKT62166.1 hypothetical protein OOA_07947 [Providencia burhodogranariea DSM 19968]